MEAKEMKFLIVIILGASTFFAKAGNLETKKFRSAYGLSVATPRSWVWDSEAMRDAKVAITEVMFKIKTDGKIRLLNTGTPPGSPDGYARVRLNITSEAQFTQQELRDLSAEEVQEFTESASEELSNMPVFKVEKDSVAFTKTRADTDYWAYRISYTRSGTNGPVRVEQYCVPFANRAVSLTLSYELAHKETLAPILLRVWSSLDLNDASLWPIEE